MIKIAPSVIAADFARLGEQMAECERSGADLIHFDAMDGHFVPNLSMGPMVLEAVRRSCRLRIDAHLMLSDPNRYLADYARAGADTLIVHVEAGAHLHRTIEQIKKLGKRAGIALNPATPAAMLSEVLGDVDQVLVMTVDPGFGGQSFIAGMLQKIEELSRQIGKREIELGVDGGVDVHSAPLAVNKGANLLVAGTAVFRHGIGIADAIASLRGI
jgi:ribulose-phosphate 3-epimerase